MAEREAEGGLLLVRLLRRLRGGGRRSGRGASSTSSPPSTSSSGRSPSTSSARTSRRCRTASIAATFLNGAIRTTEQEEMAHLLRRKSQVLIAFGACAAHGGIPGLANLWDRKHDPAARSTRVAEHDEPEAGVLPRAPLPWNGRHGRACPASTTRCRSLDQVVEVDYYHSGLPAHAGAARRRGARRCSRASCRRRARCSRRTWRCATSCPRKDSKPEKLSITAFKRPAPGADRRGAVPAGAGPAVPGTGHARRLRQPVHHGQHAVHRVLRPDQPGARLRRQGALRPRVAPRRQGRRGRSSRRSSRFPIRSGRSTGTASRRRGCVASGRDDVVARNRR